MISTLISYPIRVFLLLCFLSLVVFAQKVEQISVGVDKHLYRVYITLTHPSWFKFIKDPKRDLLIIKVPNDKKFEREFYSVLIKGSKNLITLLVKNPKLDVYRAKAIKRYRTIVVLIPFKNTRNAPYKIVIDPGHGGKDSGAIYGGVKEKVVNYQIALKLYHLLKEDPRFKPYLTRWGDRYISLAGRQKFTAKVGADLFISIHANANPYNPNRRGVEFYVLSDKGIRLKIRDLVEHPEHAKAFFSETIAHNRYLTKEVAKTTLEITQDEGEEFARILQHLWCINLRNLIPCRGIYKRAFAVLKVPGVPAILVEVGYLSNPTDRKILLNPSDQWKIARTIYRAILEYFDLKPLKEGK